MTRPTGNNVDAATVAGFGKEWTRFEQAGLDHDEAEEIFSQYFSIFPWEVLPKDGGSGADVGCGSGRWARLVAGRVRELHLIDASADALKVAQANLSVQKNAVFHCCSVDELPFADESLDFAYSLGVLHHVPDTATAIRAIASKLKPGAPLLLYLYYAFDNRPVWYRWIWRLSDLARRIISRLPQPLKVLVAEAAAVGLYWPIARAGSLLAKAGLKTGNWPLAYYGNRSLYVMRTDALDRLGTRLEQRFTRAEISALLSHAGFDNLRFSEGPPFWCAVGLKSASVR